MDKKIAIIGSTCYRKEIERYGEKLAETGVLIKIPTFDNNTLNEFEVCDSNRSMIKWADEVHLFWDGRSIGVIFDLGMAFALEKPLKIIHLNPRNFLNFVKQYTEFHQPKTKNS